MGHVGAAGLGEGDGLVEGEGEGDTNADGDADGEDEGLAELVIAFCVKHSLSQI